MQVSIIILNYNYPHNIARLLPTLQKTTGVTYEVVVVDNGSTPDVVELLIGYQSQGIIDRLVLEPVNHYFSVGNNIGVRNSNPASEFILLLNSDTEILDGDWLRCMVEWANGVPEVLFPYTWSSHPTQPKDTRRGIVSIDYAWTNDVEGHVMPDGWCCLIRREAWRDIDPDFPMAFGIVKMLASIVRDGYPCGCLSQYGKIIVHYGQGSTPPDFQIPVKSKPDIKAWWNGLQCESLDFTLGPDQHQSYLSWSRRLGREFDVACNQPSDIQEHMATLYELAKKCSHVVEGGVRYVVSTWAWIWGCACRGGEVHSYCWTLIPEIQRAIDLCEGEGLPWHFHEGDWLQAEIPKTDLLFIDTNHFYSQLKEELRIHGPKARRYIVLHDTEHFGQVGADGLTPGLWQAVEEFVSQGVWRIKDHYRNCNGLTVLERVSV
jgi:hypothetical protein